MIKSPAAAVASKSPAPDVPKTDDAKPESGSTRRRYTLNATHKALAALKGSDTNPFLTDLVFRKSFSDDADIHIWHRFGSGLGMMSDAMRLSKALVDKNFLLAAEKIKQSHLRTLTTIRFDDGLINVHSRALYDSSLNFDWGQRPLNTSLIEHLPEGNLLGMVTLHIDPAAYWNAMQKVAKGKGIHSLDSLLAKKGLTAKDIFTAFKGDVLLAMIDNGKLIAATDSTPARPGKPDLYLVFTINDKAAFAKFEPLLQKKQDSAANKHAHTQRDDIYVLGPNQQATDDYFNKPGRGPSRLASDAVKAAPVAIAIDVKAIQAYLEPMFAKSTGNGKDKQLQLLLGLFDQIVFTTAKMQGREMETSFEIKMADPQQNSLTTISKLIRSMSGK